MNLTFHKPSNELRHIIKDYWYGSLGESENSSKAFRIIADGYPGMIVQTPSIEKCISEKDGTKLPGSFVYGQSTQHCENIVLGNHTICGIRFQPTALKSVFKINASLITNTIVDTKDILPAHTAEELIDFFNADNKPDFLVQFFSKYLDSALIKKDFIVERSVRQIISDPSSTNTFDLARALNISSRQLQRRFKSSVGISIENYKRVTKFQKSISSLLIEGNKRISNTAYDLNFSDQSHFNREFKLFSGLSPLKFIKAKKMIEANINQNHFDSPIRILMN